MFRLRVENKKEDSDMNLSIKTIKIIDSFNTNTILGLIAIVEFPGDVNPTIGMTLKGVKGDSWTVVRIGIRGYLEYSNFAEHLKDNKNLWVCGLKTSEHPQYLESGDILEISSVPN